MEKKYHNSSIQLSLFNLQQQLEALIIRLGLQGGTHWCCKALPHLEVEEGLLEAEPECV